MSIFSDLLDLDLDLDPDFISLVVGKFTILSVGTYLLLSPFSVSSQQSVNRFYLLTVCFFVYLLILRIFGSDQIRSGRSEEEERARKGGYPFVC